MAKVQIKGGNFQDQTGAPLANGYLLFKISNDEQTSSPLGQIVSGVPVKVALDATGNVPLSPVVSLWPNSLLSPINSYYEISAYTASGQLVWGPAYAVIPNTNPYDLGNLVFTGAPGAEGLVLQTNGVNNGNQNLLNIKQGSNVTVTNDGLGNTTVNVPTPAYPQILTLEHNGVANGSQSLLNLKAGANVTLADDGVGGITINNPSVQPISPALWAGEGLPGRAGTVCYLSTAANTASMLKTRVWHKTTISSMSLTLNTIPSATTYATCALYDMTGARVWYLGDNAIVHPPSTLATYSFTFTPVTLDAGAYYFGAYESAGAACTIGVPGVPNPSALNNATVKTGKLAITLTGNATLPASIVIANILADNSHNFATPLFN